MKNHKTAIALILTAIMLASPLAHARSSSYGSSSSKIYSSHNVRGHMRKNGTYVAPHRATNPNGTKLDNYSTRGNFNPYTGRMGTVDPYKSSRK